MKNEELTRDEIRHANRVVHSQFAKMGEYNKSPHFLPENKKRVKDILIELKKQLPKSTNYSLLDIGCGTGFILHLASDLFNTLYGIDITDEMLSHVDLSLNNIQLQNAFAEDIPFEDNRFDMVTAYSFLDHVPKYEEVMQEAYRVLKPSGIFYADLNPNKAFNDILYKLSVAYSADNFNDVIKREIKGGLHDGQYYNEHYGLDEKMLTNAEPIKSFDRGFCVKQVEKVAKQIGFNKVLIEPQWYLGQAVFTKGNGFEGSAMVEKYLKMFLPATESLFKYLRFIFVK